MRNFIQPGKVLTMVAPAGGVVAGKLYIFGSIFGVAATTVAEGQQFELVTGDVFELPKTSAEGWATVGLDIYATAAGILTTTSSGNKKVGVNTAIAANPSGSGLVRLNDNF